MHSIISCHANQMGERLGHVTITLQFLSFGFTSGRPDLATERLRGSISE